MITLYVKIQTISITIRQKTIVEMFSLFESRCKIQTI